MLGQGTDFRGRALLVLAAAFACHMGLGFTYLFGPLQPDITGELGVGRAEYGAASQARNVVVGLTAPLIGVLAIRVGPRLVLATSFGVLCAASFALSSAQSYAGLVGGALLLGLGISGVGDITVGQAVASWFRRGRGTALGILYTASNTGGMLLVPLISGMAEEVGWREALQSFGVGALVVLLPCSLFVLPARGAVREDADPEAEGPAEVPARDLDLREAARTRSFWILVYCHVSYFAFAVSVTDHFVAYLMESGLPRGEAAGFWGSAVGLGIASKLGFGFLSDRVAPQTSMLLFFALLSGSAGVLLLTPGQPFLWIFVVLFGFSYAARDVLTPVVVIHCFGLSNMAKIYGAIFPALVVGGMSGSYLTGLCADHLGTYTPGFAAFGAMNLLALVLVPRLRRERA